MKIALAMWGNTRMMILAAVCSAIYGAALIAFKTAIPLIPGITEIRVANIFPIGFSLLFGPAGAWGAAIGNLIGDLFGGTLGPGSVAGFVGNFLLGYLPYTLWNTLLPPLGRDREWKPESWRCWTNAILVAWISSAACAVVISVAVDALGIVPYALLSKIITLNNAFGSLIGIFLLTSVFKVVHQQLGLFWVDILNPGGGRSSFKAILGAWMVTLASLAGLAGNLILPYPPATIGWVCAAVILVGSVLL